MTHRGRVLQQYTTTELRTVFIEMFCTTKTSVENPLMQPTGAGGRRSFLVLDEGELDGIHMAIGPKMKKMEQKDSLMPWTMSFGYMMNRISLGSRGDSKEEEPEKAKEKVEEKEKAKEDQAADFSDLEEKEKEERDEVKAIMLMSNRQLIQMSILKRILMRTLGSQTK